MKGKRRRKRRRLYTCAFDCLSSYINTLEASSVSSSAHRPSPATAASDCHRSYFSDRWTDWLFRMRWTQQNKERMFTVSPLCQVRVYFHFHFFLLFGEFSLTSFIVIIIIFFSHGNNKKENNKQTQEPPSLFSPAALISIVLLLLSHAYLQLCRRLLAATECEKIINFIFFYI